MLNTRSIFDATFWISRETWNEDSMITKGPGRNASILSQIAEHLLVHSGIRTSVSGTGLSAASRRPVGEFSRNHRALGSAP